MKKILLIVLLLMGYVVIAQQNSKQTVSNDNQLTNVQLKLEVKKLSEKIDSLQRSIIDANQTLQYAENTYKTAQNIYTLKDDLLSGGIALLSIIIALISLFGINFWIKNIMTSKLIELTEKNTKELQRLLSNEKWGIDLRSKVQLIVLNKKETGIKPEIEGVINGFNYVPVEIDKATDESFITKIKEKGIKITPNSFTIILLDDAVNELFSDKGVSLIKYVQKLGIGVLLYGESKISLNYDLKAFAQNPYSLYNNLMQLMKYMDFKNKL
ncbi:MAG: hypothetical protein Q8O72_05415 [Bacteroidales bacterium]|nr:hypothetical protein [Bacteroidales bacterium]